MEWIIDRIEKNDKTGGNTAVIECNGTTFEIDAKFLPENSKEGTVLSIKADEALESSKKAQAKELMDRLFKK